MLSWADIRAKMNKTYEKLNDVMRELEDSRYSRDTAHDTLPSIRMSLLEVIEEIKQLEKQI